MRAYNTLPLDDDILDRIFAFISDFDTLRSLILTSKAFYSIFQAHSNSIIRTIAYNFVGPALSQAARLVRYKSRKLDGNDLGDDVIENDESKGEESDAAMSLKTSDVLTLIESHTVVKKLEDRFSRKRKDRSFNSSVLTPLESWRFRRAMYRIMLFVEMFPWTAYLDDYDDAAVKRVIIQHQTFLDNFLTSELQELYGVALFVVELNEPMVWTCNGYHRHSVIALSYGPAATLAAIEGIPDNRFFEELMDSNIPLEEHDDRPSPVHDYLLRPLGRVMVKRNVTLLNEGDPDIWRVILDSVVGEHDICQSCSSSPGGFNLRNHTNWDTLRLVFDGPTGSGVWPSLRGNLRSNILEMNNYRIICARPFDYPKFMQEMFGLEQVKKSSGWKREDWLCENCIKAFLYMHLHFWMLQRKKEAGEVIYEDCWYGYNCKTQTHSMDHAERYNHFCEPTRPE
ncbi:hypothetical protein BDN72DRAFT_957066 [Pluteus cervinus]|uniref:Uncharacterized protein n=1 Tax=Pluteus cervinus TaxID=181527 RepID=A0ACD3B4I8_9AGAR|nr:hypothetical protein BDN72DRAFT_957066 [Pluteus cervinus]